MRGRRSRGPGLSSSRSTIRSVPARSARDSATSSATTRRSSSPTRRRSLADGAVQPWSHPSGKWYQKQLLKAAKKRGVDTTRPYAELSPEDRKWIYDGEDGFSGIQGFFEEVEGYRYKLHVRVFLSRYRSPAPCPRCQGARLRPEALSVRVGGATIVELSSKTVEELERFLDALPVDRLGGGGRARRAEALARQAHFLLRVGLGLPDAGAPDAHALGRRGPAHQPRQPARVPARRARSTCSTSRPSGSTRATRRGSPSSAASWPRRATRW